jgi:acyl-CoA dehydrogenase
MEFSSLASATALIVAVWGLAYLAAPLWAWTLIFAFSLGLMQAHAFFTLPLQVSLWGILAFWIVIFHLPLFRQRFVTTFIFRVFKKTMPKMSSTEREAIEAGDIWWESELFRGQPNWDRLLAAPPPRLTQEELNFLNNTVEALCALFDEWSVSHVIHDLPKPVWTFLKEKGFFGMIIPKSYGGLGFSALAHSVIVQKLATHSLTAAITTMVPNSLGPAELLINYGTEHQKQHYLPRLARGEEIPCFALTSPEAGSDASAITDVGIVCEGEFLGKKILGMKLTWDKRYITLAPVATVLGLAFKLYDPNKLLGEKEALGITVCLIPTTHPGVECGLRHFPLHQSFMNGPTRGKEVFVPLDWIIGGEQMIGKGWHMLVECLSAGRGISLPALTAASSKIAYRTTGAYARIRKQFNTSIGKFEGVSALMANIAGNTYMIEAARLLTLGALDQKIRPSIVTAIVKYHLTEMGRKVVNDAMDIHGGRGIMLGANNYLANAYASIPISITVEGANILTRNLIIFGQGVIRCHPYVQVEMQAMADPNEAVGILHFDQTVFKHLQYTLSNKARMFFHALTAGGFCLAPKTRCFKRYYRQLSRMSVALSFISDVTFILLGGKLKRCERLSARLGDVLSYLYLASAVLKYFQDVGNKKDDSASVNWCVQTCLYQIQNAFLEFFSNFPNRFIGSYLRFLVFPYGRAYKRPNDILENHLAAEMMVPGDFRNRLTQHCYFGKMNHNPVVQLDETLDKMIAAETASLKLETLVKQGVIPKKLSLAESIEKALALQALTLEEGRLLRDFDTARREAIRVDEFEVL